MSNDAVDPPRVVGHEALIDQIRRCHRPGRRVVVGLVGPPGSGKSYTAAAVVAALATGEQPAAATTVPLDGFHLDDDVLDALGRRDVKGRPDTFDVDGFLDVLRRLRTPARPVYAPRFDRDHEWSRAAAIAVEPDVEIVIVEGNYLLLDEPPWRLVGAELDRSFFLDVPFEVRQRRLLARHRRGYGDAAEAWIERVDRPNGELVDTTRHRADVVVQLD